MVVVWFEYGFALSKFASLNQLFRRQEGGNASLLGRCKWQPVRAAACMGYRIRLCGVRSGAGGHESAVEISPAREVQARPLLLQSVIAASGVDLQSALCVSPGRFGQSR